MLLSGRPSFTVKLLNSPLCRHTSPYDVLIHRLNQYAAFSPLNNVSGAPAISLPMGVAATGLPIGIQLAGGHGDEKTLLELGFELEQARPWRRIQD